METNWMQIETFPFCEIDCTYSLFTISLTSAKVWSLCLITRVTLTGSHATITKPSQVVKELCWIIDQYTRQFYLNKNLEKWNGSTKRDLLATLACFLSFYRKWWSSSLDSVIETRGAVWGAKDPAHTKRKAQGEAIASSMRRIFFFLLYGCIMNVFFSIYGYIMDFFFEWMYSFLCIDVLW